MRSTKFIFAVCLLLGSCVFAQPVRRLAVISANGPLARANPLWALGENRVTDSLRGKLTSQPGITIIAQKDIETLLTTQNFQNSDRSSIDAAARIGKLMGAQDVVLVDLISASQSSHEENSTTSTKTIATVSAEVGARVVDVESGVSLSQLTSNYNDNKVAGEIKRWPVLKTIGGDLPGTFADMWTKATDSLTTDLAAQLKTSFANAPKPAAALPLIAGIANGSVYINEGSSAGIKPGDKFQVVRQVNVGLDDPATGKPIVKRQNICVLTIAEADGSSSSGACQGGLPQSKDVAEPMHP